MWEAGGSVPLSSSLFPFCSLLLGPLLPAILTACVPDFPLSLSFPWTASLRTSHCLPECTPGIYCLPVLFSPHPLKTPDTHCHSHGFAPCFIRENAPFLSSLWSPLQDTLRSHLYGAIFSEPQMSGWGWGFLRWVPETRHPSQSPPCGPGRCRRPPEPGVRVTTAGPEPLRVSREPGMRRENRQRRAWHRLGARAVLWWLW